MSDNEIVIKWIEKVGKTEAAKALGLSRPTVYNRLKDPDTVTIKEARIVKGLLQAEDPRAGFSDAQYVPLLQPAPAQPVQPTVTAEALPDKPFRPGTPKQPTAQGISLENLAERLQAVEDYLKIVSTNKGLLSTEVRDAPQPTPRPVSSGEHPLSQLIRQGNPQDAPRPRGPMSESDGGWNTPRPQQNQQVR